MIIKYLKKYKYSIIGGQAFKLLEAILELMVPLLVAKLIDSGLNETTSANFVITIGIYMLVLAIVGFFSACLCQYLAAYTSEKIGKDIRGEIFRKINSLSYKQYDDFSKDSIVIKMTLDVERIQLLVAMYIRLFVRAPFILIGAFVMSFSINKVLSTVILIILIILSGLIILIYKYIPEKIINIQKKIDKLTLLIRESIVGNKVIRGFNYREKIKLNFLEKNVDITQSNYNLGKILSFMDPVINILLYIGYVIVLTLGAFMIFDGSIMKGDIVALTSYLSSIIVMWMIMIKLVTIFLNGVASFRRIEEFIKINSDMDYGSIGLKCSSDMIHLERDKNDKNIKLETGREVIELSNVYFSHGSFDNYVLKNINLTIKANRSYGIIGGTGSGKSTLINVIMRNYDVDKGNINILGNDIKEYSEIALKNLFSYVKQRGKLKSSSIKSNILWGKKEATDKEIFDAIKVSCANDFVNDKGLDYLLFEEGKNLSGGQRQRLTIARAVIKESPILILDDSFSALDIKTESELYKNLRKLQRTLIIVSQRVNSVKYCDEIIVMDAGSIKDIGSHTELIERSELYKEIVESQNLDERYN